MRLLFYVSGHGFGHAARDVEIVRALRRRAPDVHVTFRTDVPRWFLDEALGDTADVVEGAVDTGMIQPDSLSIDVEGSARAAARFYGDFSSAVTREARLIRESGARLVVGDIPPLAFAAAAAAGVPSIAVANFTWDWIYGYYPQFDEAAPGVLETIGDGYARASLALRLPFSGGFTTMPLVEDVPIVARRASASKTDVRTRLDLQSDRPLVLASFGGHGGTVQLERAAHDGSFILVATEYEAGGLSRPGNVRVVSTAELRAAGLRYTDLLAACDAVVTKLGYGIVTECLANDVPLLYTLRGSFVEQDVFIRDLPAVMRCLQIGRTDVIEGRWGEALRLLLAQPMPAHVPRTDGAEVVADRICRIGGRDDQLERRL